MKFSIITPTVERESLIACCESVLSQSFTDWEMLVQVDRDRPGNIWDRISPTRKIWVQDCGISHRNGGNSCRHLAWERATGDWLVHLDDDNTLSDRYILADLATALEGVQEQWCLFPILRHGLPFYFDPPVPNYFDTANAVVRREIGRWPDIDDYASDGVWVNALREKYPYRAFPTFRPIVVMPTSSFGAGGGINGQ